jgi:hypothetical protein
MKTFVLTPAFFSGTSDESRGSIQPPMPIQGGNPSPGIGGFSFGIFAPTGAYSSQGGQFSSEGTTIIYTVTISSFYLFQGVFNV